MSNKIKLRTFYGKEDIFSTNVGADSRPLKELVIGIEGYQKGTGDPSPENVRNIVAWGGTNVMRTRKNLVNFPGPMTITSQTTIGRYYTTKEATFTASAYIKNNTEIFVRLNASIMNGSTQVALRTVTINGNAEGTFSVTLSTEGITFTNITIHVNSSTSGYSCVVSNVQLEVGSVATDYEPYVNPYVSQITFPSEVGTVYSGILDVVSGVLRVEWKKYPLSAFTWKISDRTDIFYCGRNKKAGITNIICNKLKTSPVSSSVNMGDKTIKGRNIDGNVYVRFSDFDNDLEAFKVEIANDYYAVYELGTPIYYQLTPTQINTVLGANNIYADCGHILKVTYPCDNDLCVKEDLTTLMNRIQ